MTPKTNMDDDKFHNTDLQASPSNIVIQNSYNYNTHINGGSQAVSAELAASVVKDYLLPMFEQDSKKHLKKAAKHFHGLDATALGGSVYEELKLSDRLMKELNEARNENKQLLENIENLEEKIQNFESQLGII